MLQDSAKTVAEALADKAENLYRTRQHLCADAVLLTFNEAFDGGLTEQQVVGLTAGMSIGQGDSGCLCGAVASGALALGLFLSESGAYRNSAKVRAAVNALHEKFRLANKTTCCRVLTKKVKDDKAAHFDQCARYTGESARMVAEILFELRPELIERMNSEFVGGRDTATRGVALRFFNRIFR